MADDDPCDDWSAHILIKWETVNDHRTRLLHDKGDFARFYLNDVEPPRNLGRFNCRGDYII